MINKRQGVSLIVLVITIIVMIILAGTIILSLNNSGIIEKAQEAVDKTNLTQVRELAQMAWGTAYATGARNEEELKQVVDEALRNSQVDLSKYTIKVTTIGVDVTLKGEVWEQQGLTISNGKQTLTIGDSIAYDETRNSEITGLRATDWKVLGVNDNGELLIMSTEDIGDDHFETAGENISVLDNICTPYGQGYGAIGVRSIRVEDIDNVTGYKKENYINEYDIKYGDTYTYWWIGNQKVAYSQGNGELTEMEWGVEEPPYNYFYVFVKGEETSYSEDNNASWEQPVKIVNITSDYYTYDASILDTILPSDSAHKMLFDEGRSDYWIASECTNIGGDIPEYYIFRVDDGKLTATLLSDHNHSAYGDCGGGPGACEDEVGPGVRAVVTLSKDIKLTGSSKTGWSY